MAEDNGKKCAQVFIRVSGIVEIEIEYSMFRNKEEFWNRYGHYDPKDDLFHYLDPENTDKIIRSVTPSEYMYEFSVKWREGHDLLIDKN